MDSRPNTYRSGSRCLLSVGSFETGPVMGMSEKRSLKVLKNPMVSIIKPSYLLLDIYNCCIYVVGVGDWG